MCPHDTSPLLSLGKELFWREMIPTATGNDVYECLRGLCFTRGRSKRCSTRKKQPALNLMHQEMKKQKYERYCSDEAVATCNYDDANFVGTRC